jgi:4-amino-4-deoxychorismate mutase
VSRLDEHRERLDRLDAELIETLGERFATCREIARYKSEHELPMMQPARAGHVRERYRTLGDAAGLPDGFAASLYQLIFTATCRMEDELMAVSAGGEDA